MIIATRVDPETGKLVDFSKIMVRHPENAFMYVSKLRDGSDTVTTVYDSAEQMWEYIGKHKLTLAR